MPLIAMTREMGSLGKDVAARIAERDGRKVVYHEIIEPIASKMRLRKSHVERFLEGRSGLWERLTTDRTSLSIYTAEETYRVLHDASTAVIRGWGAVHLLRDIPHVLRVRVCAPFEIRVRRMMERLGTDNRAAIESEIELSEEAHTAITKRHFHVNWRDAEHYDLVLNTDRMSVDECVAQVDSALAHSRFRETPDSVRLAESLGLEWSIRAALRRDPRTASSSLSVQCHDGIATLSGMIDNEEEVEAAHEATLAVSGVRSVRNLLRTAGFRAGRAALKEA
jgi:cytidylate kinase